MTEQQPSAGLELAHAAAMPAPQGGALPTVLEWGALERMASTLADSDLIPYNLKRKPGDVAVILLAAREYGIPPLMALSKLPVVNGKPAPMGELMVALVLRAGHSIRADFHAPDGSRYKGGPLTREHYGQAIVRRRDWPAGVEESLTFTIEEAIAAGLVTIDRDGRPHAEDSKGRPTPWQLYTPNMARWRAVANVCRLYFPDVLMGLSYLPEELGAVVDADGMPVVGEVVDQQQPRRAAGGNLAQRTAQEAADRLPDFAGPLEVLDNVLRHAEENGYADETVRTPDGPLALSVAIARRRKWLEANTIAGESTEAPAPGTVDSEGIEEAEVVEPSESAEDPDAVAPEAASEPQEAQEQPAGPPAQEQAGETPQEAAYDVAREVLMCRDVELLRTYYRGTGDLKAINVLAVVDDGDLATLGVDPRVPALTLGSLLIAASKYVEGAGIAIRDPEPERAFDGPAPAAGGDDPWAGDSTATAEGWARHQAEQQSQQ